MGPPCSSLSQQLLAPLPSRLCRANQTQQLEYPRQLHLNLVAGDESPDLGKWAVKERRPGTADYKAPVGRISSGASISYLFGGPRLLVDCPRIRLL